MIPTRNPLAYPCGVMPGFDPNHAVLSGQLYCSFVALGPTSQGFINILTGLRSTPVGAQAGEVIDGWIGPSHQTGSFNQSIITGLANNSTAYTGTMALIYNPNDGLVNGPHILCTSGNAGNGAQIVLGSDGSVYLNWPGSQYPYNALASYKVSVTDPYFMGCSWNATGQTVSFTMNLRTGQLIFDDTQPGVTGSVHADNGIVSIGCDGSGSGTTSSIACGMYQSGYIPTALARRWCQNPWAFWYPDV